MSYVVGSHPVIIPGTLKVEIKSGRNGKFSVGDLSSPMGDFKVKDTILDQFEEGEYEGIFTVTAFSLDSFTWRGRSFTNLIAKVIDIQLDRADERPVVPMLVPEPDPLRSTDSATIQKPSDNPDPVATLVPEPSVERRDGVSDTPSQEVSPHDQTSLEADQRLFGEELLSMIEAGQLVKLDPTVDRNQFRLQRDRLKSMGYTFHAQSQSWFKA